MIDSTIFNSHKALKNRVVAVWLFAIAIVAPITVVAAVVIITPSYVGALEWNITNNVLSIDIGDTLPTNGTVIIPTSDVDTLNMTKLPPSGVYVLVKNDSIGITNKDTDVSGVLLYPDLFG